MDRFIGSMDFTEDDDLRICDGVAYQTDMSQRVEYDQAYFDKLKGYEGQEICEKINKGRKDLVAQFHRGFMLDVGIGSGEFIRKRPMTMGYDINPVAVEWLKTQSSYSNEFNRFKAFSFWDVIEHVAEPEDYFSQIPKESLLFASIPIFTNLTKIRGSRHYRPDEHYYYFTYSGFCDWMGLHGFGFELAKGFEIEAGRDSIYSFVFRK